MGLFLTRTFAGDAWSDSDFVDGSFLAFDIHDSDFAAITYGPAPTSGGLVYLGIQPRDYFDDPGASADIDLDAEAAGLMAWARNVAGAEVESKTIRSLLAEDGVDESVDDVVEDTVVRVLNVLRIPVRRELQAEA